MQYAYFLELQQEETGRKNTRLFQLINELEIPEDQIYVDESPEDRTELKALIDLLAEGDMLIIRSVRDVSEAITQLYREIFLPLQEKKVELFSCEEPYFCGTNYFTTLNNFLLLLDYYQSKRRVDGYQKAVDEGRVGRPAKTGAVERAIKLYNTNAYTVAQIEILTGVSKSTLYKYLKEGDTQ